MGVARIGSRRSPLAMWQADFVRGRLLRVHPGLEVEVLGIMSEGDRILNAPLASAGGKGLFLKELEEALLAGRVDLAVHSMKDVTVTLPDGLCIAAVCAREDPRDAFVSNRYRSLDKLPEGGVVGSCSLRRQSILRRRYPHLEARNLRGNVNTRLARLDDGDYDALILAAAGLKRLGLSARIRAELSEDRFLPAVGQGALGIECRADDADTRRLVEPWNDAGTRACVDAERAVNRALGGGCHLPVAAHAILDNGELWLRALVGAPRGGGVLEAQGRGAEPRALGEKVARELLDKGAGEMLKDVRANSGQGT